MDEVTVMVENNCQELEVWCPIYRSMEAGEQVSIVSSSADRYSCEIGYPVTEKTSAADAVKQPFDVLS